MALFAFGAGEGRGETEGDEGAAGDVSLGAAETNAGAKTVSYSAGKQGPHRVATPAHQSKQDSQLKDLQRGMPPGRIHKLRQKSKKEQRGFWIEKIDKNALTENVQKPALAVGGFEKLRIVAKESAMPR